jgi:hypothetical protein
LVPVPGHNDRVDIGEVLGAVNSELGGRWQLGRRLAGGWNEGAYLLIRGGGSRAVLKWRASDPERLLGARERVEAARARGWPAPAWLATGQAPAGGAWVVQEFIDGRTPPRLDDVVAEQMTRILGLQEAMFPGASGGWGSGRPEWCSRTGTGCAVGSPPVSRAGRGSWLRWMPSPGPARPARRWLTGGGTGGWAPGRSPAGLAAGAPWWPR